MNMPMSKPPFIIVCRFGIGIYDEARLHKLLDVFEIVTFPSLLNQSDQSYTLLMAVDSRVPSDVLNRIRELFKDRSNFKLVLLDVTEITNVQVGNFSWVWDQCQNYILAHKLIQDESEFIISSILDADDGWHRETVQTISNGMSGAIPLLLEKEPGKGTWVRHSAGMVTTFPKGYGWFMQHDKIYNINFEFHSMSIFVLCRFSSNISACSSRHSKWRNYAEVVDFEIGRWSDASPMWIYARHDEGVIPWKLTGNEIAIDSKARDILTEIFGINFQKLDKWKRNNAQEEYVGKKAASQYDLIYKIAAQNRKLQALSQSNVDDNAFEIQKTKEKKYLLIKELLK